jgi:hypothetical protein
MMTPEVSASGVRHVILSAAKDLLFGGSKADSSLRSE